MKKIRIVFVFLLMALSFVLVSCEAGSSPYSVISINKIGQTEEGFIYEIEFIDNNKYQFVVPFGIKGDNGEKGDTPYIGHNGNWWIDTQDLGIKAAGTDGTNGIDGVTPYIGENGNWWIGNQDLYVLARGSNGVDGVDGIDGQDGETPRIGSNGNWWIGNKDLGVRAEGVDGTPGQDGSSGKDGQDGKTPYIGENGNWWIGDFDTNVYAGSKHNSIPNTGSFEFAVNHDGDSYVLLSYSGKDRYLRIPSLHNGYPVTEIGKNAFKSKNLITTIFIPKEIIKIDEGAFSTMSSLENVIFEEGSNLEIMEKNAFEGSELLENINLIEANNLQKIGEYAFSNVNSLTSITIPNNVNKIESFAFSNAINLAEIIFHEDSLLEEIGSYAFRNTSIEEILFPKKLEIIGSYSFENTKSLRIIDFAENSNIKYIEEYAFTQSTLVEVNFPGSLISIGRRAFYENKSLEFISFDKDGNLKTIGENAFKHNKIKRLEIPNSVETIGLGAFTGSEKLEYLSTPFIGGHKDFNQSVTWSTDPDENLFGYIFGSTTQYSIGYNPNSYPYAHIYQGQKFDSYKPSDKRVYFIPNSLKTVVINEATEVSTNAFYGVNSVSIVFREVITKVGVDSFRGSNVKIFVNNIESNTSFSAGWYYNNTVNWKNSWSFDSNGVPNLN